MLRCCFKSQTNLSKYQSAEKSSLIEENHIKQYKFEIQNTMLYTQRIFFNKKSDDDLNINDFNMIKLLGKGKSGKAMLVQNMKDSQFYVMKIVEKKYIQENNLKLDSSNKENGYKKIKQDVPFIAQIQNIYFNKLKMYIIFDFIQGGQLFYHLKNQGSFQEMHAKFYACQLMVCLEYMHEIGFIYRTLNPNNILIDVNGNIRVVDFGKRKINTNDSYYKENMIECAYIAPELLSGKEYDKTADYWSLGILIYEMLNGAIPFYNMDKQKMLDNLATRKIMLNESFSPEGRDFVNRLLEQSPRKRMGAGSGMDELKSHRWFMNVNWQSIQDQVYTAPIQPRVKNSYDSRYFNQVLTTQEYAKQESISFDFTKEFGSVIQSNMVESSYLSSFNLDSVQ